MITQQSEERGRHLKATPEYSEAGGTDIIDKENILDNEKGQLLYEDSLLYYTISKIEMIIFVILILLVFVVIPHLTIEDYNILMIDPKKDYFAWNILIIFTIFILYPIACYLAIDYFRYRKRTSIYENAIFLPHPMKFKVHSIYQGRYKIKLSDISEIKFEQKEKYWSAKFTMEDGNCYSLNSNWMGFKGAKALVAMAQFINNHNASSCQ